MQTFLPYTDFRKSLESLDNKRLGKQRVEAYQIISAITGRTRKDGKQGILFTFSLLGGEYTDGIKFNLDTQYVDSSDPIVNDITDKLTGYYPKWSEDAWTYITEMQTRSKNQ